ncbi:MAG: AAA family ATPase, partial [Ureaplasma sp.]|nr:AAA family ATPase [Ureaplasma sp.]
MAKNKSYAVYLSNNQQWVTKKQFDKTLLELSKEYREHLYISDDFEKEWHSGEEYIFVISEDKWNSLENCNEISNKFKEENIVSYVKKVSECSYFNEPCAVMFADKIIYPSKEDYENFESPEDDETEEQEVYKNAIIINNTQPWVSRKQFQKTLFDISKEYNDVLYPKYDFEQTILEENSEYVFVESEYEYDTREIFNELKERNIICRFEKTYYLTKFENSINKFIKFSDQILRENDNFRDELPIINEPKKINNNNNNNLKILSLEKMYTFDDYFKNKIIGQNEAIEKIKQQLITKLYEFHDPNNNRPSGIFFFAGPTGVGKTEMCKQLSDFLYNNKEINRLDMSEYKSEVAIEKLIGASNGYVGYEEGGILTNKLEKNPNAILLFDEIEKADKSVFDLFLQIFDEGIITSNKGKKISLKNTFIVLTSNIGASCIQNNENFYEISNKIKEEINNFFTYELNRPEILGRIGKENLIIFNTISNKEDQFKILDIYFNKFIENFKNNNVLL